MVRDVGHLAQDVAAHDDRDAVRGKAPDEPAQLLDADGVKAVSGLVQDEQSRVGEKRQRDAQTLPHAQAELASPLFASAREVHRLEHLVDARLGQAQERGSHAQVLGRREVGIDGRRLDERADPVEVLAPPRMTAELDGPFRGAKHPADHLEQGGLARPVGT